MPAAYVQQKAASSGASAQTSIASGAFAAAVAAANALAWFAMYYHASAEQTVSLAGNGNTYVEVGHYRGASGYGVRWGYAKNVNAGDAGPTGIAATFGAAVDAPAILLMEYSGLETVNIFNSGEQAGLELGSPGTGTDGWSTGNVTPANQPALVIGLGVDLYLPGAHLTAGTDFTARSGCWDFGYGSGNLALPIDKRITGLSPVPALWTCSTGDYGHVAMMVLREASAATAKPLDRGTERGADRGVNRGVA